MISKCIFMFEKIKAQKFKWQEFSNCSKQLLTVRAGLGGPRNCRVHIVKKIPVCSTTSPGFSSLV